MSEGRVDGGVERWMGREEARLGDGRGATSLRARFSEAGTGHGRTPAGPVTTPSECRTPTTPGPSSLNSPATRPAERCSTRNSRAVRPAAPLGRRFQSFTRFHRCTALGLPAVALVTCPTRAAACHSGYGTCSPAYPSHAAAIHIIPSPPVRFPSLQSFLERQDLRLLAKLPSDRTYGAHLRLPSSTECTPAGNSSCRSKQTAS